MAHAPRRIPHWSWALALFLASLAQPDVGAADCYVKKTCAQGWNGMNYNNGVWTGKTSDGNSFVVGGGQVTCDGSGDAGGTTVTTSGGVKVYTEACGSVKVTSGTYAGQTLCTTWSGWGIFRYCSERVGCGGSKIEEDCNS